MQKRINQLAHVLNNGGVAVIRTDTLYGIVARADDERAVEKVYQLKKRNPEKSCIVLVADEDSLYGHMAPGGSLAASVPTSFLIYSPSAPLWLRRANDRIAYRQPQVAWLKEVLKMTGPIIAPSANTEGQPPARTIAEAKQYFGSAVDAYIDDGTVPEDVPPSQLMWRHQDGRVERLR
ncbi:MAG: Sua5/YciO/YrdC/YwlC family protein [Candidatus Saccharimonas sp.]